jgi:hypothetical protein
MMLILLIITETLKKEYNGRLTLERMIPVITETSYLTLLFYHTVSNEQRHDYIFRVTT